MPQHKASPEACRFIPPSLAALLKINLPRNLICPSLSPTQSNRKAILMEHVP